MFVKYEDLKAEDWRIENAVNSVSPYAGCSIISIEKDENFKKVIHYLADSYFNFNADDERFPCVFTEYSFVKFPFAEYLTHSDFTEMLDSTDVLEKASQYASDCTPEDLTMIYSNYDVGIRPTVISKITDDLPLGKYIFVPQVMLKYILLL